MRIKIVVTTVILTMAASNAWAQGSLDARFVSGAQKIDDGIDEIESESVGLDLRGQVTLSDLVFLRGQYSHTEADEIEINGTDFDADNEATIIRGGVGLQAATQSFRYYGIVEAGKLKLEIEGEGDSGNGVVISAGLGDIGANAFVWNVELGAASFDEADGAVFDFTLGYRINPSIAILLGGQAYALENDGIDLTYSQGTLGVRVSF